MEKVSITSIDFIGIGGIGMSALARWALKKNIKVSGYDKTQSEITKSLENEGVNIRYNNQKNDVYLNDDTLVVYTPAISLKHPQILYAIHKKLQIVKRSELLGNIANKGICLAVAGTHGKTTTSCLLAWILSNSGMPVQAFFGGVSANFKSNYLHGTGEITIVEADEYDRSFLSLKPSAGVITSTDPDHLDYYKTKNELQNTFSEFAKKCGTCYTHSSIREIKGKNYGFGNKEFGAENIVSNGINQYFDLILNGIKYPRINAGMPGNHNIENAVAAAAIANHVGVSAKKIIEGIETFKGVKRRFEIYITKTDLVYIDDYAHHPTALKKLINAIQTIYPSKEIAMVFQPHLYSRTRDFLGEFKEVLSEIDSLGILPIYPARENPIPGVDSETLVDLIPGSHLLSFSTAAHWISSKTDHIRVTAGAGDINSLVPEIISSLKKLEK